MGGYYNYEEPEEEYDEPTAPAPEPYVARDEQAPPEYEPEPPPQEALDQYYSANYDTMGNYGTGYGIEPPVDSTQYLPPNPYVASDYDAQGNYGAGYGHPDIQFVPRLTSVGEEDIQWEMHGAPNTPSERVEVYPDGSLYVANTTPGYLQGSSAPPNGIKMPSWGGVNSGMPMPNAPPDAWQSGGGTLAPSWPPPDPPFPYPALPDSWDDDELEEY